MTRNILVLAAALATFAPLAARTITLTAEDCDQMALISSRNPRLSWVGVHYGTDVVFNGHQFYMVPGSALLMRFPLDPIPPDQRILKAELTIPPNYVAGAPKVLVRRLLADWGTGVCHLYSRTYPKKVEWSQPGGRGASDRAAKDSAVFHVKAVGEHTVDVTEDIELWYTGGSTNRGWILNLENDLGAIYFPSPYSPTVNGGKQWKLVITFEPK